MGVKKPLYNNAGTQAEIAVTDQIPASNVASGTATSGYVPTVQEDGTLAFAAQTGGGGGGLSDGDKGDIVVSGSGSVWTLENALKRKDSLNVYNALGGSVKAEPFWGSISNVIASATLTSGRFYVIAVWIPFNMTITGALWYQGAQGNFTGNNYNGIGLYTYSLGTLTLVASTANDETIWKNASGSIATRAFSSTYSAAAGLYYIGFIFSASATTAQPGIGNCGNTANSPVSSSDYANSAITTGAKNGVTALPTTQAMSGLSALNNSNLFYIGLY